MPGLGATGAVYEPFLKEWRGKYEVRVAMHSLDFPETLDWPFFFRAIEEASAGKSGFVLIGHSMGGAIALAYAARHPERVRRTIAVAPPVIPKSAIGVGGLVRFRAFRRLQNLTLGLRGGHPGHALEAVKIRAVVLADGRRRRLYDWINQADLRHDLPKLANTVVLWPKREEIISPDHLTELREHPNITLRIVPGSHNYLPLYPQPLQPYIREALRG